MAPSVIVVGASGAVGRPLMEEFLAQKSQFRRIAVLSDPSKVSRFIEVQAKGIEVVEGSFLEAKSYEGFEVVISLVGNVAMKLQPGIIEAAIAGGARHFIPSEFGADIAQNGIWKNRYFRDKVVTREHLRARAKDTPGFHYTLILSGAVAEYTVSEFNGVDVEKHVARTYGYPKARLHVTAMHECCFYSVCKFIVGAVLLPFDDPSQSIRELRVSGDCLTWEKLMELLEEVQGAKYDIKYLDPALAVEKQEAARAQGDSEGELFWSATATMANGYALLPEPSDNHRFAFEPETAKETLIRMFGSE
ncbi:hypothetical protein C8F04DRAFT_1257903 [Mycena alexandri]|uniref:NmrA-like domain-containing protein n=1 Tax=Mycena alexandri TaxID=1745969 RepID=A0AAD6T087_9AGAR|nr:hypothetical protein C8F04DRAFT_1271182 [Mycena alexandri]KAJ7036341.1 hypothetical protein C8F04DRAFT_1257903 [Mycena alexandri]